MSDFSVKHAILPAGPALTAAIDPLVFAALRRQFDTDAALFDDLVRLFARELGPRVGAIGAALSRGDPAALAGAAHALKGSSILLGARPLAELCGRLEAAGRRCDITGTGALLIELKHEAGRVRDALCAGGPGAGD